MALVWHKFQGFHFPIPSPYSLFMQNNKAPRVEYLKLCYTTVKPDFSAHALKSKQNLVHPNMDMLLLGRLYCSCSLDACISQYIVNFLIPQSQNWRTPGHPSTHTYMYIYIDIYIDIDIYIYIHILHSLSYCFSHPLPFYSLLSHSWLSLIVYLPLLLAFVLLLKSIWSSNM